MLDKREQLRRITYGVPCLEAIKFIAARARAGVVEVGAGSGLWSRLLQNVGVPTVATDPGGLEQWEFPTRFCRIKNMEGAEAIRTYPLDVLMVWPYFRDDWPVTALREVLPGRRVFYVGEGQGGCCLSEAGWDALRDDFKLIDRCGVPQWDGLHDELTAWERV
jgi:hypothetical protein